MQPLICEFCDADGKMTLMQVAADLMTPPDGDQKSARYVVYCPVHCDNKMEIFPEHVQYTKPAPVTSIEADGAGRRL